MISNIASLTLTTVEGSVGVDTLGVLDAVSVVVLALVDVVANLALSGGKVQAHAAKAVAAGVSCGARTAAEAGDRVVAGDGHVAGIGQVTLVKIRAISAVSGQTLWTGSATAVRWAVQVETFNSLK